MMIFHSYVGWMEGTWSFWNRLSRSKSLDWVLWANVRPKRPAGWFFHPTSGWVNKIAVTSLNMVPVWTYQIAAGNIWILPKLVAVVNHFEYQIRSCRNWYHGSEAHEGRPRGQRQPGPPLPLVLLGETIGCGEELQWPRRVYAYLDRSLCRLRPFWISPATTSIITSINRSLKSATVQCACVFELHQLIPRRSAAPGHGSECSDTNIT